MIRSVLWYFVGIVIVSAATGAAALLFIDGGLDDAPFAYVLIAVIVLAVMVRRQRGSRR